MNWPQINDTKSKCASISYIVNPICRDLFANCSHQTNDFVKSVPAKYLLLREPFLAISISSRRKVHFLICFGEFFCLNICLPSYSYVRKYTKRSSYPGEIVLIGFYIAFRPPSTATCWSSAFLLHEITIRGESSWAAYWRPWLLHCRPKFALRCGCECKILGPQWIYSTDWLLTPYHQ